MKNRPSTICRRQPLKILKWYGLLWLSSTNFIWSIVKHLDPFNISRYGDRVPTSIFGRLYAAIWILCGITFIALITSVLSNAVFASSISEPKPITGRKVTNYIGLTSLLIPFSRKYLLLGVTVGVRDGNLNK